MTQFIHSASTHNLSDDIHGPAEARPHAPASSPRLQMAQRLPAAIQPFLTWLTAQPAPGETAPQRSPRFYVADALLRTLLGVALALAPWLADAGVESWEAGWWAFVPAGWLLAASGLGLFQVVIFHHCSHGTVFAGRAANRRAGRLVSALLLFKHFDQYQREHMLHHSPRKLLTEDDEFADFVFGMCRLTPEVSKDELWSRVIASLFSPVFHGTFLMRRIRAAWGSADPVHNAVGIAAWSAAAGLAAATGHLVPFLVAWVVPVTVLLQIATVFRILCEHRFPEAEILAQRDRAFACHATAGVFAGAPLPSVEASTPAGLAAWTLWWGEMLTLHLFTRLFVLVGDAPCHDFHHRHPASKKWTTYIHARQNDKDRGSPGFPVGYFESWGLFQAIDENLGSLSATRSSDLAAPGPVRTPAFESAAS